MRDEKVCPVCGGPLVWKGNVLEGALACEHCPQEEFIYKETTIAIDWAATNTLNHTPRDLRKEEEAEWNDLGLRPQIMGQEQFEREYMSGGRRTGRTFGMVLRALGAASGSNNVIILVHNQTMVVEVEDMIGHLGLTKSMLGGFRVSGRSPVDDAGSVVVVPVTANPRVYPLDLKVFADHAIQEFPKLEEFYNEWWGRYEIKS